MTRPTLGVVAAPGTTGRVRPLLAMAARWCDVRAGSDGDAVLATSPHAPGLGAVDPRRLAVWAEDVDELGDVPPGAAALTPSAEVAAAADRALLVPRRGVDPLAHPPVAPFVRARWRRLLGLPGELVIVAGDDADPDDTLAALTVAAAAVVAEPWLLPAMALGTPLVTDSASAATADALDEVDVIDDRGAAVARAEALAADLTAAAAAGRLARRAIDDRHDLRAAARALVDRLGLADRTRADVVSDRLAELHALPGARVTSRAATAAATLQPHAP